MMLRDIAGDYGDIETKRELLRAYEAGWARGTSDHPGLAEPEDRDFEIAVLRWLRHHQAMLVGEVVPIAHGYVRDNPASDELSRYRHVVVDAYQTSTRSNRTYSTSSASRGTFARPVMTISRSTAFASPIPTGFAAFSTATT